MSIIIDIALVVIYLITVIFCFKRGFLKGLFSILKLVAAFIGTYYLQIIFKPFFENLIPKNIDLPNILGGNFIDKLFQTLLSNMIASIAIFIALFLVLTLISNLLLGILEDFTITNILNRLGGLIVGLILGGIIVIISSYIIGGALLFHNSTTGLVTINDSYILKLIIQNNIPLIIKILGS